MRTSAVLAAVVVVVLALAGCGKSGGDTSGNSELAEGSQPMVTAENSQEGGVDGGAAVSKHFAAGQYGFLGSDADYTGCKAGDQVSPTNILTGCVSAEDWEYLCKNAQVDDAFNTNFWLLSHQNTYVTNSNAVHYLVRNGGDMSISIDFDNNSERMSKSCKLNGKISGIYEGSQVLEEPVDFAESFIVDESGKISIGRFDDI